MVADGVIFRHLPGSHGTETEQARRLLNQLRGNGSRGREHAVVQVPRHRS